VGAKNFLRSGQRAVTVVPLIQGDRAIGALSVIRVAPGPLSDKQLATLKTYADQAIIAIENSRLLNELRESLQQQTATADVLKVISSSPGDLRPVFDAMLAKATDLCEASYGLMWLREKDAFRAAALYGDLPQAYRDQWRSGTRYRPRPETILSRVTASGRPIQVPDLRIDRPISSVIRCRSLPQMLPAFALCLASRCSGIRKWSASSEFTARRSGRSPKSR
jgi:hypothetical protein